MNLINTTTKLHRKLKLFNETWKQSVSKKITLKKTKLKIYKYRYYCMD